MEIVVESYASHQREGRSDLAGEHVYGSSNGSVASF